jgi:hypothetical protein
VRSRRIRHEVLRPSYVVYFKTSNHEHIDVATDDASLTDG